MSSDPTENFHDVHRLTIPKRDPDDDPGDTLEYCRENPDVVRDLEALAREHGFDAFADACRDVLDKIEDDTDDEDEGGGHS